MNSDLNHGGQWRNNDVTTEEVEFVYCKQSQVMIWYANYQDP